MIPSVHSTSNKFLLNILDIVTSNEFYRGLIVATISTFLLKPVYDYVRKNWEKIKKSILIVKFKDRYLSALASQHKWLKLIGIYDRADINAPRLQKVFISLRLASPLSKDEFPRFSWEKILYAYKNPIVILGHPGSGKSTLLDYLILIFTGYIDHPLRKKLKNPIPLFAHLRDFEKRNSESILEILQSSENIGLLSMPRNYFHRKLKNKKCIVFFDGLDEVINTEMHEKAVLEITRFVNEYSGNKFIITCRIAGWCNQLTGWDIYQIQDLNVNDIHKYISSWYGEVYRSEEIKKFGPEPTLQQIDSAEKLAFSYAQRESKRLWSALVEKEDLQRIARTPLILSLITLVHKNHSNLPRGRSTLYQKCLDILLEEWDRKEKGITPYVSIDLSTKLVALQEIALYFLRNEIIDIQRNELEEMLLPILTDISSKLNSQKVIHQIIQRSGILIETRIGYYGFAHRALSDYLAASRLIKTNQDMEIIQHANEERWREIILISTGLVPFNRSEKLISALLGQESESNESLIVAGWCIMESSLVSDELCHSVQSSLISELNFVSNSAEFSQLINALLATNKDVAFTWIYNVLAGKNENMRLQVLSLLAESQPKINRAIIKLLIKIVANPLERAIVRTYSVIALSKLVKKPEQFLWHSLSLARQEKNDALLKLAATWAWCELGRYEELGLVKIPAGEFLMGSDSNIDKEALPNEQPQHNLYLPTFYIAKYPMTIAEWATYTKDFSYKRCYKNDGKEYGLHPVCSIEFGEALSYALSKGFTLPSEAEWEKAARGENGLIYPWGNQWHSNFANSDDFWGKHWQGILQNSQHCKNYPMKTTQVGYFSIDGDSPYTCTDMLGNVWEWTRSTQKPYPYDPFDGRENIQYTNNVIRGGSAYSCKKRVRCAFRGKISPNFNIGFRIAVVSPYLKFGHSNNDDY